MTSVADVYNQLKTANQNLSQLHTDLTALIGATQSVKSSVDQVNTTLSNGFAGMMQALAGLTTLSEYQASALYHLSDQNNTIICDLEKISDQTCQLVTQSVIQSRLQGGIDLHVGELAEMERTVHPAAALELARAEATAAEMAKCCEPKPQPPACTYRPCPAPTSTLGPPPSLQPPNQ